MTAYRLARIADFAHQLRLSPGRLRVQQVLAADHLSTLIDPDQYYPYSWVCWHITGYRAPIGEVDPADLRGSALRHDLLLLCNDLTRQNPIPQAALPWPVWSLPELSERLKVSTRTIRRWRAQGLPTWWAVRADGQVRVVVPESGLRRFTTAHLDLVMRSRRFSQMTHKQREHILERAHQLRTDGCTSTHRICQMLSTETGRSTETIRYTLLRHDPTWRQSPGPPPAESCDEHEIIFECWRSGDAIEALARRFGRTARTIYRIVVSQQRQRLLARKVAFIYSPEFDLPDAEARILGQPDVPDAPARNPEPLHVLDEAGPIVPRYRIPAGANQLLAPHEEAALFRRYNYCKFRLAGLLERIRRTTDAELVDSAMNWCRKVDQLRTRLIETNLRLVVATARRHLSGGASLEEMVSEGNMILLRAIEKFDYTRGFKFSTYASWSMMRHYARLMPLWQTRQLRQRTGCEQILKTASTNEPVAEALDQQLVGGLLRRLLHNLPGREREVIQWRYGLPAGAAPSTLAQVAARLGLSRERVRQIEIRGLSRLKALLDERQFQYL
jgi:RNA polymerase primary sigma factor